MKKYRDLTIQILPAQSPQDAAGAPSEYQVIVDSPEGKGQCTFTIPAASFTVSGVVVEVALATRSASLDPDPAQAGGSSARDFGEKLYDALFSGQVRSLLDRTTTGARYENSGTRIRLMMDLEAQGMAQIACLPWELMRPKGDDPLVVSVNTTLVRSLDIAKPTEPRPFEPPLRIMAVMSNPMGTAPLKLEEERKRIAEEWALLPNVKVDWVRPVVAEMRRQLAENEYHVLHYMGHGEFDADTGGALLLENEDGTAHSVSGQDFARMLADEPLRLVFLNACKTGTTNAKTRVQPFAGVATALIKKGVPAVVAMQFPISDQAAIDFAKTFYERIVQRMPVDAAVAEARKVLHCLRSSWQSTLQHNDADELAEWATPVLFMRAKDGMLFQPSFAAQDTGAGRGQSGADQPGAQPDPWGPGDGDRVFLAATNERLRPLRRRLHKELVANGVRVIDVTKGPPPPYEPDEHAAAVEPLVRGADLCVHLLGDQPGEPMNDDPVAPNGVPQTYPLEQCRIGLEAARSQLFVLPDVDVDTIEDAGYKAFVNSLITRPRGANRFEVARIGKQQIADEIMAKLARLKQAREARSTEDDSGGVKTAFVDAHRKDRQLANAVEDMLTEQKIQVVSQTSNTSPTDALSQFDVNLSQFPLYILIAGDADEDWIENRELAAMKSASRSRAKVLIGRYVVAAQGAQAARPEFQIVAAMNAFDPATIGGLLDAPGTVN